MIQKKIQTNMKIAEKSVNHKMGFLYSLKWDFYIACKKSTTCEMKFLYGMKCDSYIA